MYMHYFILWAKFLAKFFYFARQSWKVQDKNVWWIMFNRIHKFELIGWSKSENKVLEKLLAPHLTIAPKNVQYGNEKLGCYLWQLYFLVLEPQLNILVDEDSQICCEFHVSYLGCLFRSNPDRINLLFNDLFNVLFEGWSKGNEVICDRTQNLNRFIVNWIL